MSSCFAGIDISKDSLHVHLAADFHDLTGAFEVFDFDSDGLDTLLDWLRTHQVEHTVFEASGGYERALRLALLEQGFCCTCLQPKRARAFAQGLGMLEKTDKVDALMLSRMASMGTQHPEVLRSQAQRQLVEWMDFRGQLREDLTRLKTQAHKHEDEFVAQIHAERITSLQAQLERLDARIQALVDQDQELAPKKELMVQIKGISAVTAWTLLAYLPELGELDRKQIAKLAGLAPLARESGQYQGTRRCGSGRPKISAALWMASLSVARYEEPFEAFYTKLVNKGKAKSVARIAVCRKMLCALNAMLAKSEDYDPARLEPREVSKK